LAVSMSTSESPKVRRMRIVRAPPVEPPDEEALDEEPERPHHERRHQQRHPEVAREARRNTVQ